ncbi:hypothetical protein [Actinomadura litoris]|uniref:Uncharacterized protein n=1 Tax=Actinomadura litoris TaxID=2678616 RepID=A0A7K1L4A8_9ACTN|nr:hypothetical protein [Actinomadura litoris]MUN39086.1 hypothetical protein [Actinomadura litoris]
MEDRRPALKQQLPYPYDQDLSEVLRRLDRRTPASRARLANDPVTAAYLAAGVRLIENHLGPGAVRTLADPEDDSSLQRPLLAFLSQRTVAAEVARNPAPFPRVGSVSTLRSTWASHSDFIADLLRFGLWAYHPTHCDAADAVDILDDLQDGAHFVDAIHRLGYWNLLTLVDRPRFRMEIFATAAAENDPVIQKAMAENYREVLDPWKDICGDLLESRRLRLRRGVSIGDFVDLVTAVMEGVALRDLADPRAEVIDRKGERSLAGTALLALLRGCVERVDDADGLTLEEAVHAMVYGVPARPGRAAGITPQGPGSNGAAAAAR